MSKAKAAGKHLLTFKETTKRCCTKEYCDCPDWATKQKTVVTCDTCDYKQTIDHHFHWKDEPIQQRFLQLEHQVEVLQLAGK